MSPSKDPSNGAAPKLAIKGFSLKSSSSSSSKPKPPTTLGKRPRSTFGAHDSDSEGDDGAAHETVIAFGDGRAIKQKEEPKKEPLVIQRVGNRDWKGEARRLADGRGSGERGREEKVKGGVGEHVGVVKQKRNLLPEEVQALRRRAEGEGEGANGKVEGVDVVNSQDGEIKWGLSVRRKSPVPDVAEREKEVVESGKEKETKETQKPEMTADEEALAALTGAQKERKGPELVIPLTEEEAYRHSVASAPDPSTLEDYERVPVEEFGAALLRGMGWNGEEKGGVRDVKRRQNLLGLGARELKDAEELGAWVGKSDVKRLNGGDRGGRGERRPRVNEFLREKEVRDQRREERGGGSYRREKERDRYDSGRDSGRERYDSRRDSGRESGKDRDGYRERERERDRDRRR